MNALSAEENGGSEDEDGSMRESRVRSSRHGGQIASGGTHGVDRSASAGTGGHGRRAAGD